MKYLFVKKMMDEGKNLLFSGTVKLNLLSFACILNFSQNQVYLIWKTSSIKCVCRRTL